MVMLFQPQKWSSTMKQHRSEEPYEVGSLTSIINSFGKDILYFFKIHGTSPPLKNHELEGPVPASDPVLSNHLGQYLFLVFE